jgi:hypothetical protein
MTENLLRCSPRATIRGILLICGLREKEKGDQGETARVTRRLAEATALKGLTEEAAKLTAAAEKLRKEIQKN